MAIKKKKPTARKSQGKKFKAWALRRLKGAYVIVELDIDGDRITGARESEGNFQPIQLDKVETAMIRQANDGL